MRCRETNKVCYSTHTAAWAVLQKCEHQRKVLRRVYRMERGVYLCDHCDHWHLTSKPR